jgi:hypothetical protein
MAASDLTEMLSILASDVRLTALSESTEPKLSEALGWINDGIKDVIHFLLPARLDTGKWTPGRTDKLLSLSAMATATDSADPNGFLAIPTSPRSICFYRAIRVNNVRAVEVSLRELYERVGTFAATSTAPIYAWAIGMIHYRPVSVNAVVKFDYLTLPADMVVTTAETFPIAKDLIPVVLDYARMSLHSQGARDPGRAFYFFSEYMKKINDLIGSSQQLTEPHRV